MSGTVSERLITALALPVLVLAGLARPHPVHAQDAPPPGWYNTTELTAVWTAGNALSSTVGLKNDLRRLWENATLSFQVGGIRTESSKRSRRAIGTLTQYSVLDSTASDVTAENYYVRGRLDRAISEHAFVYGSGGWVRNTFAGVQNRYTIVGGAGNTWVNRENALFKTDYGVTYTVQDDVTGSSANFAGLRIGAQAMKDLTATTKYTSTLIVDENLASTADLRADFTNAIAVSISDGMALKTSLQLMYDNEPSLTDVPLFSSGGNPFGQNVTAKLKKMDSLFTVALVIDF